MAVTILGIQKDGWFAKKRRLRGEKDLGEHLLGVEKGREELDRS